MQLVQLRQECKTHTRIWKLSMMKRMETIFLIIVYIDHMLKEYFGHIG